MKILLLLVAAAVVTAIILWRGRRDNGDVTVRDIPSRPTAPADERQVLFRPGPNACAPARQQAGSHLPAGDRPRLPLPGCRAHRCQCRFEAVQGRRREQRRQTAERRESIRFDDKGGDRRKKDRRKGSADPWGIDRE